MSDRPEFGGGGGGGGGVGARPIIIKRIIKGEHAHHGGAWKVAYADFVTTMMAFFLLLWLLSTVNEETLEGISDYFTPIAASTTSIGAGGEDMTDPGGGPSRDPTEDDIEEARRAQEEADFEEATEELEQLIKGIPELSELSDSLLIDNTPEGLRIQIADQDGLPLFPSGSAAMYGYTREIFGLVSRVINKLTNEISISGHTDATPFNDASGYSNWELSADRALATRRVLQDFGVSEQRVAKVTGQAANDPLLKDDPGALQNRRISIVLLRSDDSDGTVNTEQLNRLPDFLDRGAP